MPNCLFAIRYSLDLRNARRLRLLVHARDEARPRDDHALVPPLADQIDAVVRALTASDL